MSTVLSLDAVCDIMGKEEANLVFWSASDIIPHCRTVLKFRHASSSTRKSPQHVFGDIMERIDITHQETLGDMYRTFEAEFNEVSQQYSACLPADAAAYAEDIGCRFMESAMTYFEKEVTFSKDSTGFCYKCNTDCLFCCPEKPPEAMGLTIGGSTCTSWSRMGRKRRWAAASALPFLVWAFSVAAYCPDAVIHECTFDFDHHHFERMFG